MPRLLPWIALACLALASACVTGYGRDPGAVAAAYAAAGRLDDAEREIDVAVRDSPEDPALRKQAAAIHRMASHREAAIAQLEAAIQLTPEDPEIWIELGELENERENAADAYVAFRRAAELDPDEVRAVSGLALSADILGFDDEARAAYAHWAELEQRKRDETPPPPEP